MKPKQLVILSLIFGVLAFGIVWKSWVRTAADNAGAAQGGLVAFSEFDPMKLEKILISRPEKTGASRPASEAARDSRSSGVELARENGVWKVRSLWNAKADPVKVKKLIEKLRASRGELRGSGKKLFPDFGIEDAHAFSIRLLGPGDRPLQELRVGTKRAGEDGYFVRTAANENVYLARLNLAELLGIFPDFNEGSPENLFWADLHLFNVDPEKVTKVTIHRLTGEERNRVAGVERETDPQDPLKSSWKFLRQGMSSLPDPDKVLKLIAVINSIRAEKIVAPDGKGYGLEAPVWQLSVTEGLEKTLLSAGSRDQTGEFIFVKHPGVATIFVLKASFFSDLNVDDTNFLKEIPPAAGPKSVLPPSLAGGLPDKQNEARPSLRGSLPEGQEKTT